jgi:hypothetical protein
MKLKKISIMLICTTMFVLSAITAAATPIKDGTGDVWHWSQVGTTWSWSGNVATKPNIDITQIDNTISENKIILTLTVAGSIENSEKIIYWMYYNTTDATYLASWTNGDGKGYASKLNQSNPAEGFELPDNVTASGNTITATFTLMSGTTTQQFWAWAAEYTDIGSQASEWWGDWAPNSQLPGYINAHGTSNDGNQTNGNTNGTSSGTKTPGFEVLPVIAAIAVAAILIRRRR